MLLVGKLLRALGALGVNSLPHRTHTLRSQDMQVYIGI